MKTQSETTIERAYFKIHGDWLTGFVRSLWAEGSFDRCFRTLEAAFPEMDFLTQSRIIAGTKKLEGVNNLTLLDDNWKPDLQRCAYGHYPNPMELPRVARSLANKILELEKQLQEAEMEVAALSDTTSVRGLTIGAIHNQMFAGLKVPTVEKFIENIESRDERASRGFPKPDPTCASEYGGWVLPNGKFYGCETEMEHIWLASMLGKEESAAEGLGWVKISTGLLGTYILRGRVDPTQKQIDTVFTWCERHKKELPAWAGGKD